MSKLLPRTYRIQSEVSRALQRGGAVVALESAVITHGLPFPKNAEIAREVEQILQVKKVTPATIALIQGRICIGVSSEEITALSRGEDLLKVSARNIGIAVAGARSGGTTVAATLLAARTTGIKVFSTGGIGGVHRGNTMDVSADLNELAKSRVIVVCAGAKSILDLPATIEALDSRGIPVLGYGTDEFPAFYSRSSGLRIDHRVDTAEEIAVIAQAHWTSGNESALLVCNPLPVEQALESAWVDELTRQAVLEAEAADVSGAALTPFLLSRLRKLTDGKTLEANLSLLRNNASLAADISILLAVPANITF